ncbi:MAG TPA: cation transporter, partial [Thermoleophilia bacterium]|nr:cation transporter [Thermoleophilia bacterium]
LLGHTLENVYLDGVGSLIIGLLLASAALILIRESKGLLVGEAADDAVVEAIGALACEDPSIVAVGSPLTMQLGPERVLLNLEMEFVPGLSAEEVRDAIDRFEQRMHDAYPEVADIFVEAASVTGGSRPAGDGRGGEAARA